MRDNRYQENLELLLIIVNDAALCHEREKSRMDLLLMALGLNAVYLAAASWWFLACLKAARRAGKLLQVGE